LFGIVVAFGESACFATYWANTYPQLFLCRILTGISIGGSTPIIFSLLGDLYPGKSRVYVSTLIGISMSSGIGAGQLLSGLVGPKYGWHLPFLLVSIPALLCALLVFTTVEEPRRGDQEQEVINLRRQNDCSTCDEQGNYQQRDQLEGNNQMKGSTICCQKVESTTTLSADTIRSPLTSIFDEAIDSNTTGTVSLPPNTTTHVVVDDQSIVLLDSSEYNEKIECKKVTRLFSTCSALIIFIQGLPGCLPWGMIFVFLNDYLSEDRGMSVEGATIALTCFGLGGLFGQIIGGWFGQVLYNINPRLQCLLMGTSTIVSVFPMLYLLNTTDIHSAGFYIMAVLAGFTININGPNVRVVLQVMDDDYFSSTL
jgi:predicted MFS family arabinose efflux permease